MEVVFVAKKFDGFGVFIVEELGSEVVVIKKGVDDQADLVLHRDEFHIELKIK